MTVTAAQIARAAEDVAQQVGDGLQRLRDRLDPAEVVYVYALVVPDDFASVSGYGNTASWLAKRKGTPTDKWQFAEWFGVITDIQTGVLLETLGDATFQDDRDLQHTRQASWLLAMAEGLKLARARGTLDWRGQPITAFCSVIDSYDAVWVERETARMINPPELFAAVEPELAAAWTRSYGTKAMEPQPLHAVFDQLRGAV